LLGTRLDIGIGINLELANAQVIRTWSVNGGRRTLLSVRVHAGSTQKNEKKRKVRTETEKNTGSHGHCYAP